MLALFFFLCVNFTYTQDVWVNTSSGGYWRTAPNSTNLDNFSTIGNINPYTGKQGTITPDYSSAIPINIPTYYNLPEPSPSSSYGIMTDFNVNRIVNDQRRRIQTEDLINKVKLQTQNFNSKKGGKYFSVINGKKNYIKQTITE